MNIIRTVDGENATLYEPDPLYARFRTLRQLIDDHTHEELLERKSDLQHENEELEAQYGVDSPTDLRERAAATDSASETMGLITDASDWDLALYHLSVVNEAIDNFTEYANLDQRVHA